MGYLTVSQVRLGAKIGDARAKDSNAFRKRLLVCAHASQHNIITKFNDFTRNNTYARMRCETSIQWSYLCNYKYNLEGGCCDLSSRPNCRNAVQQLSTHLKIALFWSATTTSPRRAARIVSGCYSPQENV